MVSTDQAAMPAASRRGRSALSARSPTGTRAAAYSTCGTEAPVGKTVKLCIIVSFFPRYAGMTCDSTPASCTKALTV
jgi:hypothetical protein